MAAIAASQYPITVFRIPQLPARDQRDNDLIPAAAPINPISTQQPQRPDFSSQEKPNAVIDLSTT
jgi:hypothetical protein